MLLSTQENITHNSKKSWASPPTSTHVPYMLFIQGALYRESCTPPPLVL